jgi:hypothetical protein
MRRCQGKLKLFQSTISGHLNGVWGTVPAGRVGIDAGFQCKKKYFTEMTSGSEAGSCLRLIYVLFHSTLGVKVIQKKEKHQCRPVLGFRNDMVASL